jgi:hypothetical protein
VTLLAAVGLGYLALPAPDTHWTVLDLAGYRGVYNSAYVGTATALTGTLWLTLGGFYVVRNAIGGDESTGVGELLAATSLRTPAYLAAKFAGNLLILASMAGVLVGTALVLQLARGESRTVAPVALLLPFLVLTLPMLAVTAALAITFDSVPRLRAGLGNVVWFILALIIAIGGQSAGAPLGGLGVRPVFDSLRGAIAEQGAVPPGSEFSFGFTYRDDPFQTVTWAGFTPSSGFLLNRFLLTVLAIGVALAPALWFARFDPSRKPLRNNPKRINGSKETLPAPDGRTPVASNGFAGEVASGVVPGEIASGRFHDQVANMESPARGRPARTGATFARLVSGELRILIQGTSRWWWLVAAGLTIAGALVPLSAVPGLLLATGVWPVLIWSRLGSQRIEHDLEEMLRAYPRSHRRVLAEWSSGVVLTAGLAAGPALRMILDADHVGTLALLGGVLFVPSAALLFGLVSRSHRLFQALYLPLWFLIVNGVAAVDYLGAVREQGQPAGPPAALIIGLAAGLLLAALGVDAGRARGLRPGWPSGKRWWGRAPV